MGPRPEVRRTTAGVTPASGRGKSEAPGSVGMGHRHDAKWRGRHCTAPGADRCPTRVGWPHTPIGGFGSDPPASPWTSTGGCGSSHLRTLS